MTRKEVNMVPTKALLAATAFVFVGAVPAMAHHAFAAEFDADSPVKLTGKVTRMEWINPHAWIHMEVAKEDGSTEIWMVESGSPPACSVAVSPRSRCCREPRSWSTVSRPRTARTSARDAP